MPSPLAAAFVYLERFLSAVGRHWLAITLGGATGLYVAFGASLGLMVLDISGDWDLHETALAFTMDTAVLVGVVGGGFVGYTMRRRRS